MLGKKATVVDCDEVHVEMAKPNTFSCCCGIRQCHVKHRCAWRLIRICILTAMLPVIFVVVVLPLFVYFFPHIGQCVFFLNFRRLPMTDYGNVSSNGVESMGRAFFVTGKSGQLGVWHILPSSQSLYFREHGIQPTAEDMEKLMTNDSNRVLLYLHGNSFDRTMEHRVLLYNVLSKLDFHIIAFDYRGYGDSEGSPTEDGIVDDAHVMYNYTKERAGNKTIIVWGHSMGTGVSTKMVMDVSLAGNPPSGLVLESPFNNLHDAIVNHPLFIVFFWMNEFFVQNFIMKPLNSVGLWMDTDTRIANVTCPILILHAQDDETLPVKLGRRLRDSALAANRSLDYFEFDSTRRFGHKHIHKAKELPELVLNFTKKCETTTSNQ